MNKGIVVGQTANVQRTPDWLKRQLQNVFGASMIGLYVGEDLVVDGSNNVINWPGRIGPTAINGTANRFQKSILNNRNTLLGVAAAKHLLTTGMGLAKTIIAVAGAPPNFQYQTVCMFKATNAEGLTRNNLSDLWLSNTAGTIWYKNGLLNSNIGTDKLAVFQSDTTANVTVDLCIGGNINIANTYSWPKDIGCIVAINNIPSTNQRSLSTQLLQQYYGI